MIFEENVVYTAVKKYCWSLDIWIVIYRFDFVLWLLVTHTCLTSVNVNSDNFEVYLYTL